MISVPTSIIFLIHYVFSHSTTQVNFSDLLTRLKIAKPLNFKTILDLSTSHRLSRTKKIVYAMLAASEDADLGEDSPPTEKVRKNTS